MVVSLDLLLTAELLWGKTMVDQGSEFDMQMSRKPQIRLQGLQ